MDDEPNLQTSRLIRAQRREMARGGFWGLGTMGIALIYGLLAPNPHPTALLALAAGGCVMSVSLGLVATWWAPLIRARRPVMLLYTTAHIALTAALAIADGGANSPMALGFFGTFTFTASAMPLRLLPLFGSCNAGAYLLVYVIAGATRPGFVPVELAGMLATGIACAQQRGRLVAQRRQLHAMARTDPLTGSLNRRGFDERLTRRLAAAGPLPTLLILDLDAFKAINDRWGHAAGDQRLIQTTRTMREILGAAVPIGRLGGDEFVALLPASAPGEDRAGLIATLEERISGSIGAVQAQPGQSAQELLAAADRDLYARKAMRKAWAGRVAAGEPVSVSGPA